MKRILANTLCLSILVIFGITAAYAQSAKQTPAGFDPADARPRVFKQSKIRDPLKPLKKNQYMDQVEENLPRIFDRAEGRSWNLEFDEEEADDLFDRDSEEDDDSGDDEE